MAISPGGDSHRERDLIQIWLRGAVGGGFGPALSEFDATGVPAPVASSVESCSHLANHQASASHNGITVSSAFLAPRTNAVATEHAIPRSWSSQARLCAKIPAVRPCRCVSGISAMYLRYLPSYMTLAPESIFRRDLVGALTGKVHTTQKAAQMAGQRNNTHCQKFHGEAIARQEIRPSPSTKMHPPHQPDQDARDARKY